MVRAVRIALSLGLLTTLRLASAHAEPDDATTVTKTKTKSTARDLRIGVGLELRGGTPTLDGSLQIDVAGIEETFNYSPGLLGLRVWATGTWSKQRPKLRWIASLTGEANHGGQQGDDENSEYVFGTLIEPSVGLEYGLTLRQRPDLTFPVALRVGAPVLIPHSDFGIQLDELREVGAWPGPRFGILGGVSAGMRKGLGRRTALRIDLVFEYGRVFLLRTRAEINGAPYHKDWDIALLRAAISCGLEVTL